MTIALAMLPALAVAGAAQNSVVAPDAAAQAPASSFTVFVRAVPVGTEQVSVTRTPEGWTIKSTGRAGAPLDITSRLVQVRYDASWKPLDLVVDATIRGQTLAARVTFSGTTATTEATQGGQSVNRTDTVAPDAIVLPNPFFGPYEAVAARLADAKPGAVLPVYIAGQTSLSMRVAESNEQQIQTASRLVTARRTRVTFDGPAGALSLEIWAETNGRLLRISVPAQNLEIVREDIASVAARLVAASRPNDELVRIVANGFSLAGTISKPAGATAGPLPAIVMVGGSGTADRDETAFGIPIFGQLASDLADLGHLVLRYDKRGVGQSGGRAEAAALSDFAEDLRAAVKHLSSRKDVDPKRIVVLGHGDGGSVALLAATQEKRIAALALVAAPGTDGASLALEQQQHALDRMNLPDAEKQAKIELQKRIHTAVLTGTGWQGIPLELRTQVDRPGFQSLLAFDPAKTLTDVKQPIIIVQGELDRQVPLAHADRLEQLARARKGTSPVEVVKIPGLNHLLVPATTGEVDEYQSLKDRRVSPAVAAAILPWLHTTLTAAGAGR